MEQVRRPFSTEGLDREKWLVKRKYRRAPLSRMSDKGLAIAAIFVEDGFQIQVGLTTIPMCKRDLQIATKYDTIEA